MADEPTGRPDPGLGVDTTFGPATERPLVVLRCASPSAEVLLEPERAEALALALLEAAAAARAQDALRRLAARARLGQRGYAALLEELRARREGEGGEGG